MVNQAKSGLDSAQSQTQTQTQTKASTLNDVSTTQVEANLQALTSVASHAQTSVKQVSKTTAASASKNKELVTSWQPKPFLSTEANELITKENKEPEATKEIETSINEIETSINEIETSINEIETSINEIETSINEIETSINEIETKELEAKKAQEARVARAEEAKEKAAQAKEAQAKATEEALLKMYVSFKRKKAWSLVILAILSWRLPLLFWVTDRTLELKTMLYFKDADLWCSLVAPSVAALLPLLLKRTTAAIVSSSFLLGAYALLLEWDAEFALSRPEIMCAAVGVFLVWTVWALSGRIKVLESIGCGR